MKHLVVGSVLLLLSGHASAQACWSEWEYDGDWLVRAGQCTENVSISNTKKLCRSRVKSDEPRTAESCPATARVLHEGQVYVEPVEFRCMGYSPRGAGGSANVFHYGLSKSPKDLDLVRDLCTQLNGRWEAAK